MPLTCRQPQVPTSFAVLCNLRRFHYFLISCSQGAATYSLCILQSNRLTTVSQAQDCDHKQWTGAEAERAPYTKIINRAQVISRLWLLRKQLGIVMSSSEPLLFPPHCSLSVCSSAYRISTHYCYNVYCFLFHLLPLLMKKGTFNKITTVQVRSAFKFWTIEPITTKTCMVLYYWRLPKHCAFYFPTIYDNNMAGARIRQMIMPLAPLITESQNEVCDLRWGNIFVERKITSLLNNKFCLASGFMAITNESFIKYC